ncbi:MAG: hypothetical protein KDA53_14335 [Hyphomonas sp.]|nr:hypothetical protein [Hyphomonas sp.]
MPIDDAAMLCWLETQLRVLEAWQTELATRPDTDPLQVDRLARHHAWLSDELARLLPARKAA